MDSKTTDSERFEKAKLRRAFKTEIAFTKLENGEVSEEDFNNLVDNCVQIAESYFDRKANGTKEEAGRAASDVNALVRVLRSSRDAMLQVNVSHPHLSFVKQINEIEKILAKIE